MSLPKRMFHFLTIICLLCILVTWVFYFLRGEQRWDSLDITHMEYPNGWQLADSEHTSDPVTIGPGLSLQSGTYTIEWEIDTDADNKVSIVTDNNVNLSPSGFIVHAGEHHGEFSFTLLETSENLQFLIYFEAGSYLEIGTISMRGVRCSDRAWLLTFILLLAGTLFFISALGLLKTKQDFFCVLFLLLSAILAALPAFRSSVSLGHDGSVHIRRLQALVSALSQKQFPVRISGTLFNGYGSLFAVFYPAFILYPAAIMVLCHASLPFAFQSTIILITLLSAISMYFSGRKLFTSRIAGLSASILFLFSPYRLTNVFTRVALGEAAAMAFLPLFYLELIECVFRDRKRWPLLAIWAALLVNTHLLTALFCAVIASILTLFSLPKLIHEKRLPSIFLALLFAFGLSVSSLTPMYTYYIQGIDVSNMLTSMSENTLSIGNLLGVEEVNTYYWERSSRSIGTLLLFSNVMLFLPSIRIKDREHSKLSFAFLFIGILFCFLTTSLFPWYWLSQITGHAVDIIQFPYRFLSISSVFLALSGGFGVYKIIRCFLSKNCISHSISRTIIITSLLVICVIQILPIYARTWSDQKQFSAKSSTSDLFTPPDYLLTGTSIDHLEAKQPKIGNGLTVKNFDKFGVNITCDVSANTDALLTLPLFLFNGYSASLNNRKIPIWIGENNRISLLIKAGNQGKLNVTFSGKPAWRLMDIISLLFCIVSLVLVFKKRTG